MTRTRCPKCFRWSVNMPALRRYAAGKPCSNCVARWKLWRKPKQPDPPKAKLITKRTMCTRSTNPPAPKGPKLPRGLACDLAELAAICRENGHATVRLWHETMGGRKESAERHWLRMIEKMRRLGIPYERKLIPVPGTHRVAVTYHGETKRCAP